MSAPTADRKQEILASLRSTKCDGCGGTKRSKFSHCGQCYYRLPASLRARLYRQFGHGYEEAFEESLVVLKELRSEVAK